MTRLAINTNPDFAGKTPRKLRAVCHDGSPFLTVKCPCGEPMHFHESQIEGMPPGYELVTRCKSCGDVLEMQGDDVRGAFAQMRSDGWIE